MGKVVTDQSKSLGFHVALRLLRGPELRATKEGAGRPLSSARHLFYLLFVVSSSYLASVMG
jgi:hypothetical protein